MDLVPIINGAAGNAVAVGEAAGAEFAPLIEFIRSNAVAMLTFGVLMAVVLGFMRKIWSRLSSTIEDTIFSNWRLALLGATGLVLSLASGWTTWDGMKNFTGEPTLSLMITFGIQGVMLIVAWLIGESFATGMHLKPTERQKHTAAAIGGFIVAALVVIASIVGLFFLDSIPVNSETALWIAVGVSLFTLVGLMQWELVAPYFQSSRIIMRNAVLWVMFIACMVTSVFFSFDSLFSTIFPANERARAAQLRAQNQVSGLVADIGQTIATRHAEEAERLFTTEGWNKYEEQLDTLAAQSQGAQQIIEDYFNDQLEARNASIAEQQERISTAKSSQASLKSKKIALSDELARLQSERPEAAVQVEEKSRSIAELQQRLDEQRAVTLAEERGVEGSGKVGRGKFWRESKAQETRLQAEMEVARKRLASPQDRLTAINQRITSIKSELALIEGDVAKLEGEADTATQRIAVAGSSEGGENEVTKIDPSRVLPAFEKAKAAFRQDPTADKLNALHAQCTLLRDAMFGTPTTKERVRGIDCDPKQAGEAAAVVFALNAGTQTFQQACAGGSNIARIDSTDGLFGFARQCLSDSGLPSEATEKLRTQINLAELNRDDKAHRFVVTWNAFQDGNRLAYLALAIAVAIDLLVFMSGLFGANAVRSPLQDVPSSKARSAHQLEGIIENALLPDKFANAHAALEAMQPITPVDGFTQEVIVPYEETPDRSRVLRVLNAASTIGAVARDPHHPERYYVRPELFEFLSVTAKRCFESEKGLAQLAELRQVVTVSLQPYVGDHAEIVLDYMHPINEKNECTSEVMLDEVPAIDLPLVRKVLNAGMTLNYAQQDDRKGEERRYYIHKDLFKTISLIAATVPKQNRRSRPQHPQITGPAYESAVVRHGGDLTQRHEIEDHSGKAHGYAQDASAQSSPPNTPPPVPQSNDGAQLDATTNLERYYRDQLLETLGFKRSTKTDEILSGADAHKAAVEAWNALQHHAGANPALQSYIAQSEQTLGDRFKRHLAELQASAPNNSDESAALQRVETKMYAAWPILMLHPDIGLVQSLIDRIDDAASNDGALKPEDQDLRDRLYKVLVGLNSENLAVANTWQEAENALSELSSQYGSADLPNVLRGDAELDDSGNVIPIGNRPNGTRG